MPRWATNLTVRSLAGLVLGIAAGVWIFRASPPGSDAVVTLSEALVRGWTNAFRLLVLPLVMTQLYLAVAGMGVRADLARASRALPAVFVGLLVLAASVSALFTWWAIRFPWLSAITLPSQIPGPEVEAATGGLVSWVNDFIPPNLIAAAAGDNILPLMLFAIVFALAARRLPSELREPLSQLATSVNRAVFILVDWLLVLVPVLMLSLGLATAARSGARIGGTVVSFTLLEIIAVLVSLGVVVIVGWAALGGPYRRVARVLAPAQLAAATTRSSLATMPILISGFEREIPRAAPVAGYVIPIAGGLLKLSRAVSGTTKFLFLAAVLGVPLSFERVVIFAATIILLSPSTVGVPRVTSGGRSLPAYVAAGIPAEYVLLLGATTAVTDVFLTMINSAGYFTAAAVTSRLQATGDG